MDIVSGVANSITLDIKSCYKIIQNKQSTFKWVSLKALQYATFDVISIRAKRIPYISKVSEMDGTFSVKEKKVL